ncbi:DNA polymerase III subunit gamma/tau [Alkalibacterium olivapovliticus]|uniref:DNA-directed DNA polymerase n=1 Tax=Alkalibacterium olivapovliticus TaxID=99907 RepID=A0A2T0W7Q9_9LACT|nr:DNA polymerase III subunit gamma/tau [Alkalibacterium olivapovliticus]PRY82564.1 DNA polymerase-3 subunit gamma/tau [Alkalibacterium olivapovliticus]
MSYQALYRVWRPQRFEDVAGQEAVTKTLRNALSQGNTSHAYLFSGPRGTGKTSAAKIFAKAMNCPHAQDGEPCNACDICKAITLGNLNDVIEIDAASNNGVEEIRDIREKANYAPTQAEYKVYIIDEVHMLSMGAFNALLKTLEEPPANVVFILATTEPHKIPLTIISRTQRFDFRRISPQDIIRRMTYILKEKEVEYEEDALLAIAKAAEGGMRDALSILDQALSFSDGLITLDETLRITGSITQELLSEYVSAALVNDTEKGLSLLHAILQEGKDANRLVDDTILFCRDILIYSKTQEETVLKMSKVDDQFKQLSAQADPEKIYDIIRVMNQTHQEMRQSSHAEVYLEVATVRLTQPVMTKVAPAASEAKGDSQELSNMKDKMQQMQKMIEQMQQGVQNTAAPKPAAQSRKPKKQQTFKVNQTQVFRILEKATKDDLAKLKDVWPDLIDYLPAGQKAIMKTSKPVAASPNGLVVTFDYDILCERAQNDSFLLDSIGDYLEKVIGHRAELCTVPSEQWPTVRQSFIQRLKKGGETVEEDVSAEQESAPEEDAIVTEAIGMFGKEIVTIKE